MHVNISKKLARVFSLIGFTGLLIFSACQKEYSNENGDSSTIPANLTTKVNTAVSGFVTDENDLPVSGAAVKSGLSSTTSDRFGYFEIKNLQLIKNAAFVSVEKAGYFKGIKTYIATNNKSAFFRIKLIPKTIAGTLDAVTGGAITLSNGLIISLPATGVIDATTKTPYTGTVQVAAFWIDPTANNLNVIMPGDLRGITEGGELKRLNSYGMAAIELIGASGQLLQVAPGKKATLTMPIPASLLSGSPNTIPLWYFNETTGLWKEEGKAIKVGNTYVGDVSHFSFWNCDVPNNYIHFDCTIVDATGAPVAGATVKISVIGGTSWNSSGYGWTDSSGYTGGAIPNSAQLLLEVFTEYYNGCNTPVYSQPLTTTNAAISLGNINIGNTNTASVTGTITDCVGGIVTNGYVLMERGTAYYRYPVNSSGVYNFTTALCGNNVATFIGVDAATQQQSAGTSFTLTSGPNTISNLIACGISTQQFLNYNINGTNYSFINPPDSLYHYINYNYPNGANEVIGYSGQGIYRNTSVTFNSTNLAQGSTQTLLNFSTREIVDSFPNWPLINVNITEYGIVGQFIAGNFTGTLVGAPPANNTYAITCNFRFRRQQ